ncbi:FAD-dependent oxidoreductase, partial [Thermus scotoductus]
AWGRSGWGFGELVRGYTPSDPTRYALRGLNLSRQDDGSLLVNALLLFGLEGLDPLELERRRQEAALEAERVVAFLREKDPLLFGTARLAQVAPLLYIRESRHLKALYRLRAEEVLLGKDFPDAVALGAYPLDGQAYFPGETPYLLGTPAPYGVPFRTLVPREVANLLVVSQAAGFDSVAAFSARVVPLQMALGEA